MNNIDNTILKGLQLIKEPDKIDFYPRTIGWECLFIIIIVSIIYFICRKVIKYKRNRYRREACILIKQLYMNNNISLGSKINKMSEVLKRVCIQSYPNSQVSVLYGKEWIIFIQNRHSSFHYKEMSNFLEEYIYYSDQKLSKIESLNFESFVFEILIWIKKHHV
ncbi:DUF4381 domain-containing protein [Marinilabiliaceae bacterium JC040]|nr:DUF4381 domain-containing protein [Marinilabiliaceae bacterium JC040]